jgi:hypothetical protein
MVSELILSFFVDSRQRRKDLNIYQLWYQEFDFFL